MDGWLWKLWADLDCRPVIDSNSLELPWTEAHLAGILLQSMEIGDFGGVRQTWK